MRSRILFWSLCLVFAIAGLTGGSLIGHEAFGSRTDAVWMEVYQTPAEMARAVDAIVLARVAEVRPGRTAGTGDEALPFQIVEIDVLRGLKGAKAGERVSLERAGNTQVLLDHDGGAFERGATYLLFLKRQPEGPYYYQVNRQARYLVHEGRLWAADPDDPVAQAFESKPLDQGLRAVRAHLTR